jgi:hypothetical protein
MLKHHPPVAYKEEDYVACKICGSPTPYLGTKLCNGCYEFDSNIDRILETDSGADYINRKICEHNARVMGKVMQRKCELQMLGFDVFRSH